MRISSTLSHVLSCLPLLLASCGQDSGAPMSTITLSLDDSGPAHRSSVGASTTYRASASLTINGTSYGVDANGAIQFPTPGSPSTTQLSLSAITDNLSGATYLPDGYCPMSWTSGAACSFGYGAILVAMTSPLPSSFTPGSNTLVSFAASLVTNNTGTLPVGTALSGIQIGITDGTPVYPAATITGLFFNTSMSSLEVTVGGTGSGSFNASTTALTLTGGVTLGRTGLTSLPGATNPDGSLTVSVPASFTALQASGVSAVLEENSPGGQSGLQNLPKTTITGTAALAVGCSVTCNCLNTDGDPNRVTVSCSATGKNAACSAVLINGANSGCKGVRCTDADGTSQTLCPGY